MNEPSTPDFPTYGPPWTGESWHEYFTRLRDERRPAVASDSDDDDDTPSAITILTPAHEVAEGWPRGITSWRNLLLALDYEVKVGHSVAHNADTHWKNGSVRKPAHDVELWWLNAWDGVRYITVTYHMIAGKAARSSRTVRGVNGLLKDNELKELIENGY